MKITDVLFLNIKKLKARKGKAMFLIIPIAVLVGLSIIVSSQIVNVKTAIEKSVFGTIENQSRVLQVQKDTGTSSASVDPRRFLRPEETQFSESDLATIKSISNIENASINSSMPISNIKSSDLFEGKTISVTNLVGIDSSLAALYSEKSFTYNEGQAIPIIINASNFKESYEDWGGKTEITLDMESIRGNRGTIQAPSSTTTPVDNLSPNKTKSIEYDKESLIGKEFSLNVGGFENAQTFNVEGTDTGMKFVKLTDDELNTAETKRKESISKYWDYDKLKTPISYKFVIVGVIEEESNMSSYIPLVATNKLMHDYVNLQLTSRNATAIVNDDLNSTYLGLTYDGVELSSAGNVFGMLRGRFGPGLGIGRGPREEGRIEVSTSTSSSTDSQSYTVPGLVIETTSDDQPTVVGLYSDVDVYEKSLKYGESVTVTVNDAKNRDQVIKDLNDKGYAYQDFGNQDVIAKLQSSLSRLSLGFNIVFILFTIAVVILTMSKFVSDSRKEIGIFRAIGMTKLDIKSIFVLQALIYTGIGYGIGCLIGIAMNFMASAPVNGWFQNFVSSTLGETYNVVSKVDPSVFSGFNWLALVAYTLLLFVIAFTISLIPATRASNISPVEAITGE